MVGCVRVSVHLMPQLVGYEDTRSSGQCYFVIILIFLFILFMSGQTSLAICYEPIEME